MLALYRWISVCNDSSGRGNKAKLCFSISLKHSFGWFAESEIQAVLLRIGFGDRLI